MKTIHSPVVGCWLSEGKGDQRSDADIVWRSWKKRREPELGEDVIVGKNTWYTGRAENFLPVNFLEEWAAIQPQIWLEMRLAGISTA